MRNIATIFCFGLFLFVLFPLQNTLGQTVIYSENFESGTANAEWWTFYSGEDNLIAKPMAQAPKALTGGGNYVGWLQDVNVSYAGSAVATKGAGDLKDYSIEADVYCYVYNAGGSAYTGLIVYADTAKHDFYKLRADFDGTDRINFSGLKTGSNYLPLFNKDFKGTENPGIFPTTDGWHKMKIEVRATSASETSFWCYFDGTLLTGCPITDTTSTRATSGSYGLYSFQNNTGIASYFDNIVVTSLVTSVDENANSGLPEGFSLKQNYPNPFNPETQIDYHLATGNFVSLTINDLLGRQIKTLVSEIQSSGSHSVKWNGNDEYGNSMPAGVYFFTLKAGTLAESKKMILLK